VADGTGYRYSNTLLRATATQFLAQPHALQREVFGNDPDTKVSGVLTPTAETRRTDGGWRVSGKWYYNSGSWHASWAVLDSISSKLKVARVPSTSILEVTATSTNPREARDLANATVEAYRDHNKAMRNARVTEARRFIENQLKDVETRGRRTEAEIWAFREANRIIAPGAESSVLLSLFTQVRGDIEKARQQRIELEAIQQRFTRLDPTSGAERIFVETSNPAMQRLQATYSELLLERNNLALEVTEKHPRLQALDDRMREVRMEMRREVAAQIAMLRNRE